MATPTTPDAPDAICLPIRQLAVANQFVRMVLVFCRRNSVLILISLEDKLKEMLLWFLTAEEHCSSSLVEPDLL